MRNAVFLTAFLGFTSSVVADESCVYPRIEVAKQTALRNFDSRFSQEDNLQIAIDNTVTQVELRSLLACIFNKHLSKDKIERLTGPITFEDEVYQMYGNDYSFGVVGTKKHPDQTSIQYVAKMTAKITSDGYGVPFELFVLEYEKSQKPKWYTYKDQAFVRDDARCLTCHASQAKKSFIFGIQAHNRIK